MKPAFGPVMALVLVTLAFGGTALASSLTSDGVLAREPGAPGPFTAHDIAVPDGWKSWSGDDVHKQCGELKLVFLNPDLQEDDSGVIQASGTFFIQFQAVGANADQITRFSFSFGASHSAIDNQQVHDVVNCNDALPDNPLGKGTAGAYLPFYRSDFNADDGFFVPIETKNVPDGPYAAAVHAYTGTFPNYVEVARAWAVAYVENCPGDLSLPNSCPNDAPEDVIKKDKIMPWPIVLPGDGTQTNDVNGLTIEVAEPTVAETAQATINGEPITLSPWTPPARDVDLVPLNDDTECPVPIRSVCEKKVYADGYKWEGTIEIGDIIRVDLEDANGNRVTKQIHYGFTSGGASTLDIPVVDYETLSPDSATVNAGDTHRFNMRLKNVGANEETAHINLYVTYNKTACGCIAQWENVESRHEHDTAEGEVHVMIGPGEQKVLDVVVKTSPNAPKGTYPIEASLEYPAAGETVTKSRTLYLNLDSMVAPEPTVNATEDAPEVVDSPALGGLIAAGAAVGLVAFAARRRR